MISQKIVPNDYLPFSLESFAFSEFFKIRSDNLFFSAFKEALKKRPQTSMGEGFAKKVSNGKEKGLILHILIPDMIQN